MGREGQILDKILDKIKFLDKTVSLIFKSRYVSEGEVKARRTLWETLKATESDTHHF